MSLADLRRYITKTPEFKEVDKIMGAGASGIGSAELMQQAYEQHKAAQAMAGYGTSPSGGWWNTGTGGAYTQTETLPDSAGAAIPWYEPGPAVYYPEQRFIIQRRSNGNIFPPMNLVCSGLKLSSKKNFSPRNKRSSKPSVRTSTR